MRLTALWVLSSFYFEFLLTCHQSKYGVACSKSMSRDLILIDGEIRTKKTFDNSLRYPKVPGNRLSIPYLGRHYDGSPSGRRNGGNLHILSINTTSKKRLSQSYLPRRRYPRESTLAAMASAALTVQRAFYIGNSLSGILYGTFLC